MKNAQKCLKKFKPIALKDVCIVERALGLGLFWGGNALEKLGVFLAFVKPDHPRSQYFGPAFGWKTNSAM